MEPDQNRLKSITTQRTYRHRRVPQTSKNNRRKRTKNDGAVPSVFILFSVPRNLPVHWTMSTTINVLVDHLLYARGLIPMSVAQMKQSMDQQQQSPSLKRKINQCLRKRHSFHDEWNTLQETLEKFPYVLISLGSSFSRAKEYYRIQNYNNSKEIEILKKLPSPLALARRLLPKIIESDSSLPSRLAPSFQLWVSVFLKIGEVEKTAAMSRWVPRPGFEVPTNTQNNIGKNERVVEIRLSTNKDHPIFKKEEEYYWISAPTAIKGFRS